MSEEKIQGLQIAQNMLRYAEIEANKEAYLDALFAIDQVDKDIEHVIETEGCIPEVEELSIQSEKLRKRIIYGASHAKPKKFNYDLKTEASSPKKGCKI